MKRFINNCKKFKLIVNSELSTVAQAGFTLVELLLVMGIMSILIGLATINLSTASQNATLSTTVDTFIADMKEQQMKAMSGYSGSSASTSEYGIHFETNSYTLFRGTSYSPSESNNFVVSLPPNIQFTTQLPIPYTDRIVFLKGSGEVPGGNPPLPRQITFENITDGSEKTLQLNKYGVVMDVF